MAHHPDEVVKIKQIEDVKQQTVLEKQHMAQQKAELIKQLEQVKRHSFEEKQKINVRFVFVFSLSFSAFTT